MSSETIANEDIVSWLADNPQDKFGKHEYAFAQYGLNAADIAASMERYLARYEVEREG